MTTSSKYPDYFTEYQHPVFHKKCIVQNPQLRSFFISPYTSSCNHNSEITSLLKESYTHFLNGTTMKLWETWQQNRGGNYSSNMLIPYYDEYNDTIRDLIILCHPDDCQRIAMSHVQKMPNLKCIMTDSVISTTNNQHWMAQKTHFVHGLVPINPEIEKNVMKISELRVQASYRRLFQIAHPKYEFDSFIMPRNKMHELDMNEFFLNETQAQLQLALLGTSESFQQKTNKCLRSAFSGKNPEGGKADQGYVRQIVMELMDKIKSGKIDGILGRLLKISPQQTDTELYGNLILFLFAGHDTTGHTLTWLIYELCRHPKIQERLKQEIREFWDTRTSTDNQIKLEEFQKLPFLDKCIAETLRLYPAVANGSFRQLEYDDFITSSKTGKQVKIPKGTYVQIPNFFRHRNPDLWGKDAHQFNPDREFKSHEIWTYNHYINPESNRYSPFLYNPRSCLGKHFAQIEMRLMLLYYLRTMTFTLGKKNYLDNIEFNKGTMGPRKGLRVYVTVDQLTAKL